MTTAPAASGQRSPRLRPLLWGPVWSLACAVLAGAPVPGVQLLARLSVAVYLVLGPWSRLWALNGARDTGSTGRMSVADLWLGVAVVLLISPAALPLILASSLVWAAARLARRQKGWGWAPLTGAFAALGRIALPGWLGWVLARVEVSGLPALRTGASSQGALLPLALAAPFIWACFSALDLAIGSGEDEAVPSPVAWRVPLFLAAQVGAVLTLAAHGAGLGAGILTLLAAVQLPMLRALGQGRLRWFSQAGQPALLAGLLVAALSLALQGA